MKDGVKLDALALVLLALGGLDLVLAVVFQSLALTLLAGICAVLAVIALYLQG